MSTPGPSESTEPSTARPQLVTKQLATKRARRLANEAAEAEEEAEEKERINEAAKELLKGMLICIDADKVRLAKAKIDETVYTLVYIGVEVDVFRFHKSDISDDDLTFLHQMVGKQDWSGLHQGTSAHAEHARFWSIVENLGMRKRCITDKWEEGGEDMSNTNLLLIRAIR